MRAEQLDPEDVRDLLVPCHERICAEVEAARRFGREVRRRRGMGVFGAPTAYGDDPERAVPAALAVRGWVGEDGLQVRIAVNTGEAIVRLKYAPATYVAR